MQISHTKRYLMNLQIQFFKNKKVIQNKNDTQHHEKNKADISEYRYIFK